MSNADDQGAKTGSVRVEMGPAGLPEFTTIVNVYKDGAPAPVGGSPGQYSAVVTLSRPGIRPLPEYEQRPSTALRGDSHIAIAKPAYAPPGDPDATEIRMTGREGVVFSGHPNEAGFLAGFKVYPFEAADFMDAYVKAYARVAPSLSMWSAHLDVPLHVFQVDVLEIATKNTFIAYVNPFPELPFAVPPGLKDDKEFEALTSLYREALNSNSLPYQFLCFYRRPRATTRPPGEGRESWGPGLYAAGRAGAVYGGQYRALAGRHIPGCGSNRGGAGTTCGGRSGYTRVTVNYAAGVTKSSLMRNAADDPVSTRLSRINRTASRMRGSLFSSSGRP